MKDKYSQGSKYNSKMIEQYYFKAQDLQREYYKIQNELNLLPQ